MESVCCCCASSLALWSRRFLIPLSQVHKGIANGELKHTSKTSAKGGSSKRSAEDNDDLLANWPTAGRVEFRNVVVRYPGTPGMTVLMTPTTMIDAA